MRRLFTAATIFLALGLGSGLLYRELTKHAGLPAGEPLQLGVAHTHLLSLGVIVPLIALALTKLFDLSAQRRLFSWFFVTYVAGVAVSSGMMIVHGMIVLGGGTASAAVSGVAGLGHILLTVGLVLFMVLLGRSLKPASQE